MSSKIPAKARTPKKGGENIDTRTVVNPLVDEATSWVTDDARKKAQMQRKAAIQEAALRRERQKSVRTLGMLIALAIVVAGGAFAIYLQQALRPPPPPPVGQEVPIMASYHLTSGTEPHPAYSTDPPTSGPHIGDLASWGVHLTDVVTKELAVHSLEDGGVNVNFQPNLDKAVVVRLAALVQTHADLIVAGSEAHHVLMYPYPGLSNPIVLTAWRHIDRLDNFDEARIERFINTYAGIDHHQESGDRPQGSP